MVFVATRSLAIGAAILGGIVAGFSINRVLVDLPAWATLGPEEWARFTLAADLGKGLLIYPAEGLAALVCSIGAAVVVHFDRSKSASLPLHLAAIAAVLAFVVTRFSIAPHILSLRTNSADLMNVQNAFTLTRRWWELKAGLHAVTFACNTWALIALGR